MVSSRCCCSFSSRFGRNHFDVWSNGGGTCRTSLNSLCLLVKAIWARKSVTVPTGADDNGFIKLLVAVFKVGAWVWGINLHVVPIVGKCSLNPSCGTFPSFLCEALLNQVQLKHHYRIFVWWVIKSFLHHVNVNVIIQRIQVIINTIETFSPFSHETLKKCLPSLNIACVVVPCSFWTTMFSTTWVFNLL